MKRKQSLKTENTIRDTSDNKFKNNRFNTKEADIHMITI